ncbi:MAG TPA: DUF61 family protein [Candidatus Syntrophoarchaeum butanivorans]|uniref:UPF0216 protein ENI32_08620 n=1 Tax=Candidatus Syntropharchaeum butanivorans TaxID=1839936 RepID=A0A1F2P543_9EURY|nr:MAG: protein containing DUF61 [Candidatus Syntrophoarchaeum butanivorans]HEC57911.1 DUF61 family protein [Candidatus Syntrophoarchaeum butanivorans]
MDTDRVIAKAVQSLNRHLPRERKSLYELLREDRPSISSKDGDTYRIKRDELEMIADLIPEDYHRKLYLPVLIEICPEYGRGAAKIRGKVQCSLVMELLKKEWRGEEEIIIYRPEVSKIRRVLPTASQYAFFISLGL